MKNDFLNRSADTSIELQNGWSLYSIWSSSRDTSIQVTLQHATSSGANIVVNLPRDVVLAAVLPLIAEELRRV